MSTNTKNDNKSTKSVLYRLSWNNNGKQLNKNIGEMLAMGQKCVDLWIACDDNDKGGTAIIQYFETIDRTLVDLQQCIMNTLNPSTLAYRILSDRVEFKNKLSDCQCATKISKLEERIAIDREKMKLLLQETTFLNHERQNLQKKIEGLEIIFQHKEEHVIKQHEILIDNFKQQLSDNNKELDNLRFRIRKDVNHFKDELRTINLENYSLRQRLLRIQAIEQNYDQQRQKFITEIRMCQNKLKIYEHNLKQHKDNFCKVSKENDNLKQELSQISSVKQCDCKVNKNEYQKNINTLEESVLYFMKRNLELKQMLNLIENYSYKEDNSIIPHQRKRQGTESDNPGNTHPTLFEDNNANILTENTIEGKVKIMDVVNNDSCAIDHQEIEDCVSILRDESLEDIIIDQQTERCLFYPIRLHEKKSMGDKEEAD